MLFPLEKADLITFTEYLTTFTFVQCIFCLPVIRFGSALDLALSQAPKIELFCEIACNYFRKKAPS